MDLTYENKVMRILEATSDPKAAMAIFLFAVREAVAMREARAQAKQYSQVDAERQEQS